MSKPRSVLLPLGAIAAGFGLLHGPAFAQAGGGTTLAPVPVRAKAETDKETVRASVTGIGKGTQELRDIPQSVTVVTERLMDDRNLDDFRDVLRTVSGITFLSGETGEEDIRLRGFSLGQAGDIYVDGLRDVALYERDPFNLDRIEVLKGSASMLFGRGSTGGVVNQASKQPLSLTEHRLSATVGTGKEVRLTGDFNVETGEDAALRVNAMVHEADNHGATVRKRGIAPTFRWGIGRADEFSVGLYALEFSNVPNYNHPWFLVDGVIKPVLPAKHYFGLASDHLDGNAAYGSFSHIHRFGKGAELKTTLRHGRYERDLWASVIRFGTTGGAPTTLANIGADTLLLRTPKGRIGISEVTQLQSDYTGHVEFAGLRHDLLAGVEFVKEDARRNNNFAGPASGLTTTVGTPNDGDAQADLRGTPAFNTFDARSVGVYLQDTLSLTETLKLLGGLRFDRFKAGYRTAATTTGNGTAVPSVAFSRADALWSPRLGMIYQPDDTSSYYVSFGTSYNTSGDTYQFTPAAPGQRVANTPPEKSRNVEIGAKFELLDNRLSLAAAVFRSDKYNERNTDPDTAASQELLSGQRHATGLEVNLAGRLTPAWEAFANYTWIPDAKIDRSNVALNPAGTGAQVQGDRPGLTPRHSASLWTTWQFAPAWRVGGGVNLRGRQNPEGARHVTADSFATADLMLEYTVRPGTTVQLNVANLTDELYADMLYRGFYTPGAARSAQLTVKTRF